MFMLILGEGATFCLVSSTGFALLLSLLLDMFYCGGLGLMVVLIQVRKIPLEEEEQRLVSQQVS